MRLQFITFLILLSVTNSTLFSQNDKKISGNTQELKNHVYYLASPKLQGRNTGEPGNDSASEYIARNFQTQSVATGNGNSYFQNFYLYAYNLGKNVLIFDSTKRYKSMIQPLSKNSFKDSTSFIIQYVGIESLSNYKPRNGITPLFLLSDDISAEAISKQLIDISKKYHINKLLFTVSPKSKKGSRFQHMLFNFDRFYSRKQFEMVRKKGNLMEQIAQQLPDSLVAIFYSYYLYYNKLEKNLQKGSRAKYYSAKELHEKFVTLPLDTTKYFLLEYRPQTDSMKTRNVIGMVEGSSKKDECIIVCAHYDHVGKTYNGICVGADDNASGTSALIELAAKFAKDAKNGIKPERSILFVAFSAEEKGLIGSEFYTENPIFPLNKTVAVINLDMIGRTDIHKSHFVHATLRGPNAGKLKRITKQAANQTNNFTLDLHPGLKERLLYHFGSDHYRFSQKHVRNMVLFTDDHSDYHTPADTPDKLDYENMAVICEMVEKLIRLISEGKF